MIKGIFICSIALSGCASLPIPAADEQDTTPVYDYAYRVYYA